MKERGKQRTSRGKIALRKIMYQPRHLMNTMMEIVSSSLQSEECPKAMNVVYFTESFHFEPTFIFFGSISKSVSILFVCLFFEENRTPTRFLECPKQKSILIFLDVIYGWYLIPWKLLDSSVEQYILHSISYNH